MVTRRVFIIFVLPVVFSLIFGSTVMVGILQGSDETVESVSTHVDSIEIIGLSSQYSTSEPVKIQVKVNDSSFECGDLYVTIYSSGNNEVITQGGFFEQCFASGSMLIPVGDEFSKVIDVPGSYEIVADMISKQLKNTSTRGVFTVK